MEQQFTIVFPTEAWRDAFVAWMNRTGAADFMDSKETRTLYGEFDDAELRVDVSGGVVTVNLDVY